MSTNSKCVVFAMDAFKGTLASYRAGEAAEQGFNRFIQTNKQPPHPNTQEQKSISPDNNTNNNNSCMKSKADAECVLTPETALHFVHCPMSDGGAGLLDSLTYHPNTKNTMISSNNNNTGTGTSNVHTGTNNTSQKEVCNIDNNNSIHKGNETKHEEPIVFERVYIPPEVRITGPLGLPLRPKYSSSNNKTHTDNMEKTSQLPLQRELQSKTEIDTGVADANAGISFACDIEHKVIVIEMAEASGLPRIASPLERNPLHTTTFGTGEVLLYALSYFTNEMNKRSSNNTNNINNNNNKDDNNEDYGVRVFMGIGGSATNDGGLGALQALGLDIYVYKDANHKNNNNEDNNIQVRQKESNNINNNNINSKEEVLLTRPFTGKDLACISRVHITDRMKETFATLAQPHDLNNNNNDKNSDNNDTTTHHNHGNEINKLESNNNSRKSAYVKEFYLICDVNNPLIGPRGATYTFGPQKCAPLVKSKMMKKTVTANNNNNNNNNDNNSNKQKSHDDRNEVVEDDPVGKISSDAQRALLNSLEHGMRHAAIQVVRNTWEYLLQVHALPQITEQARLRGTCLQEHEQCSTNNNNDQENNKNITKVNEKKNEATTNAPAITKAVMEKMYIEHLLHNSGGGGAGGMSGFFRYVIGAR